MKAQKTAGAKSAKVVASKVRKQNLKNNPLPTRAEIARQGKIGEQITERKYRKSPEQHGTAFLAALRHVVGDEESDATITIPLEIPMHAFDWVNLVAMSNHLGWTEEEIIGELVMRHLAGLPRHLGDDKKHDEEMFARFAELDKAKAKR
jgi:hypothetical protein